MRAAQKIAFLGLVETPVQSWMWCVTKIRFAPVQGSLLRVTELLLEMVQYNISRITVPFWALQKSHVKGQLNPTKCQCAAYTSYEKSSGIYEIFRVPMALLCSKICHNQNKVFMKENICMIRHSRRPLVWSAWNRTVVQWLVISIFITHHIW